MPALPIQLHETQAKTLTRLAGSVDPWFLGRYGMNLYRGCQHACAYCDGRAEKYFVAGDFARDIVVKTNAVELFRREISRRKEPGFVFVGGGVSDAYQPVERRLELTRGVLAVVRDEGLPVHILTKSRLVERDFDLLDEIRDRAGVILSMSIQSVDDAVRRRFEPHATPIERRFVTLRRARERGYAIGVMAMPVLPGISDQVDAIASLVQRARDAGADFVLGGALTLRPGAQQRAYLDVIADEHPALLDGYRAAYRAQRPSGAPAASYVRRVDERFRRAWQRSGVPGRPPRALFAGRMPEYAEVAVLLEHQGFLVGEEGGPGGGPLAAAGRAIQGWARERLARAGRRRGFTFRQVETEFCMLCASGDLARVLTIPEVAARQTIELLQGVRAGRRVARPLAT